MMLPFQTLAFQPEPTVQPPMKPCPVCHVTFETEEARMSHLVTHFQPELVRDHTEGGFKCSYCDYGIRQG